MTATKYIPRSNVPCQETALLDQARLEFAQVNYGSALEFATQALDLNPKYPQALAFRSRIYSKMAMHTEAVRDAD